MAARYVAAGRILVAGMGQMAGPAFDEKCCATTHGRGRFQAALRRPGYLCAGRISAMPDAIAETYIENRTFDELKVGDTASSAHTVTQRDIDLFATVTGDVNPAHVDPAYAETDMFHHIIIHGMWGAGLISAALGTKLPGPGTIYLGQDLRFTYPVSIGDTITATLTVREKKPEKGDVTLDCVCTNQHGEQVITGSAFARAPTAKIRRPRMAPPYVRVGRHDGTNAILARAGGYQPVPAAIVFPADAASLEAALAAKQ